MISDVKIAELKVFPEKLRSELVKPKISKLWYRGEWDQSLFTKCVAVVGSRKMSRYGKEVIGEIVPRLCNLGHTIVSGLMYGIDQEAHKIALNRGGKLIGVLGYGFGVNIEEGADKLQENIIKHNGLVVSEYPPGTVPQRFMFLQRNRVVVAMSENVIVVEAGEKSGSLHTASLALKQNKQLYAVPGSIFSSTSKGTNSLIAATLATALTIENHQLMQDDLGVVNTKERSSYALDLEAKQLIAKLKLNGPVSVNELSRLTGERVGLLVAKLLELELGGMVKEERGVWRII